MALSSDYGLVVVCKNGTGIDFSEEEALKVLSEDEIIIDINLHDR